MKFQDGGFKGLQRGFKGFKGALKASKGGFLKGDLRGA